MISALAFDGNGVLYYRDQDFPIMLMEYIRMHYLPELDIKSGVEIFSKFMRQSFNGNISKSKAMNLFLDTIGISGEDYRNDILSREIEYSRKISLFPGEKETLLELARRGFKMGMITNSFQPASEKAMWFQALQLSCAVEVVISSIDVGAAKPSKAIYLEFARRIGISPNQIAFIGHEAFELEGAKSVGMLPVSFNCPPENREKYHIERFPDLLNIFAQPGLPPRLKINQA